MVVELVQATLATTPAPRPTEQTADAATTAVAVRLDPSR
jgi:hypothetical protein